MFLRSIRFVVSSIPNQIRACHVPMNQTSVEIVQKPDTKELNQLLDDLNFIDIPQKPLTEPHGATELDEFAPQLVPTFNLAAYANKSTSLKKFIELGVDLSAIEKRKGLGTFLLKLDFDRDCKDHLMFLNDHGVCPDGFGKFITKNPLIFKENLQDMKVRINYLESKNFTPDMISRIIDVNPFWLMFETKRIDKRLGYFQKTFHLSGKQVRELTVKQPRLITYNLEHIDKASFSVKEEMGFDQYEIRELILAKPRLLMLNHEELLNRFEYVHNKMQISHKDIVKTPEALLIRQFKLKQRHEFLVKHNRNQYDPSKELYVSLLSLVTVSDREFVENLAKSCMEEYEIYLKSL